MKHIIRKISVLFLLLGITATAYSQNEEMETLLVRLDSVLANNESYVAKKESKIAELRKQQATHSKLEERMWFNKMLYDEYMVYQADSAMRLVNANISIAEQLGRKDKKQEWKLNKVFLLAAQGLLNEAEKEMKEIDFSLLHEDLKFQYYNTKIYLYSHLAQFIGGRLELAASYYDMERQLQQEATIFITPDNPSYYSFQASLHREYPRTDEGKSIQAKLKEITDSSALSTLTDAINAYMLAVMYHNEGNEYNYIKYLTYSAIADLKICNRDIASLEELANILYQNNDIDRGYTYINHCLKAALQYPNRVRVVNISAVMDKLQQAYSNKNKVQEDRLRRSFYTTSTLSVILLIFVSLIYIQFKRLARSRKQLAESNNLLNVHIRELSDTQQMLAKVNGELNTVNEQLKENNKQLAEANYVKEEYIGYVFSICSNYITKLEEYKKNIKRKLIAGKITDIKALVSDTSMTQAELKEFYHSFDAIFLHIYPDFVEDFNSLLRTEEQVTLKNGELLNTELRIYALVRLGINDSVKIAEFLHCSPQTVYNNRLRTRNKALVSKEKLAERVRTLGKFQM